MHGAEPIDLSTPQLSLAIAAPDRLGVPGAPSWLADAASPLFAVMAQGHTLTARSAGVQLMDVGTDEQADRRTTTLRLRYSELGIEVVHNITVYDASRVVECWQSIRNVGATPIEITRLDSIALELPAADYQIMSFTGDWGREFESVREPLTAVPVLESRRGRSSKDRHPWFALFRPDGAVLSGAVAWSGNWVFRFEPSAAGSIRLSGGLHDWEFAHTLRPSAELRSAPVVLALGENADLNTVSVEYGRVGRRSWYPRTPLTEQLPVEWNHWWPYEDHDIDEQTFRANVDVAAELGIGVCTLDAGWFGPTDAGSHWYDFRGDWDMVNSVRFPSGLRALSDYVHERGMAFGLWCEIEALGQKARLAETHPEFVALRDGERLGYVCLGNPEAEQWALDMLGGLIERYGLDWIKLDFNLDPGAGCDRADHGHGPGDGLHAHYAGYYRMLETLRGRFPHIVLENCSSGGLRIDLGMVRRTTPTFLSDPDWPEHGLQLIWGASTMLAPPAWLHWGWSHWFTSHPRQTYNPHDPALQPHQLDYYVRIGMLGTFGLSQKLPELPAWIRERYREHIALYRSTLSRFVGAADFYRLTEQPRRDGRGSRWAAFQYRQPGDAEHLVAIFRLPGGGESHTVWPYGIDAERTYTLEWLGEARTSQMSGADLIRYGLRCADLPEEGSALVLIK